MPNYYNPYNSMPVNYAGTVYPNYQSYMQPAQSYAAVPQVQTNSMPGMIWVDGEVGAKAFQMPAGITGPVALWDMNAPVVYLKSVNQMGMPNPLQKIHYQMEETPHQQQTLPVGQSGAAVSAGQNNNANYVTKDEMNTIRDEIQSVRQMLLEDRNQIGNQNSSNMQNGNTSGNINSNMIGNRGGNR